jgi:light-regulated signal transduction histidine kinase (bacteriophytochrome)
MKPLTSENYDAGALESLGRASVQIVHDLKNQLNGLKLYATFLRKRMEKAERPQDEQETVAKLIAGLERAAADMALLVRISRPIDLRLQPEVELGRLLMRSATSNADRIKWSTAEEPVLARVDPQLLGDAFSTITSYALASPTVDAGSNVTISIRKEPSTASPLAVIEWSGLRLSQGVDPFQSFIGSEGIRMSLAARIVSAHRGQASGDQNGLRVSLPV